MKRIENLEGEQVVSDKSTYGVFVPGKEYKIGAEAPTGYYILSNVRITNGKTVSPFGSNDASMRLFEKGVTGFYPHQRYSAYWGIVAITDAMIDFL